MSMLRGLARRGGLHDVVHLHSARSAEEVIFGPELCALAARRGYRLRVQHTGEPAGCAGRSGPPVPRLAGARDLPQRAGRMLDAMTAHWERARRARAPARGALPAGHRRATGERGEGGRSASCPAVNGACRRRHADPRRRRGGRRRRCLRLPHGHLPHLRRAPVLRAGARPAHRQGLGQRARWSAPASTRPRARRDRALNRWRNADDHDDRSPLARLTDAQFEDSRASSTRSTTRSSPTSATATGATSRA